MLLTFTHPVIADARTLRSTEPRKVVGTVETTIDIAEFEVSDIEPAFEVNGKTPIVAMGGRLWRKSELGVGLLSNSFDHLSKIPEEEIAMIDSDFHMALMHLAAEDRQQIVPKPPASFSTAYLGNREAMEFLGKAGPITERKLASIDEVDVDLWRSKMRGFLENYAIVEGVTYERCHEPLMVVDGGRIMLDDSSIYRRFVNRTALTQEGWIQFPDRSLRSDVHVFPADAEHEVMQFSADVNAGEAVATWFNVDCHGKCTPLSNILERETCRFAMMHAKFFSEVDRRFRRRFGDAARARELKREGSDFGTYAHAVMRAAEAVVRHETGDGCYDDLSGEFENLVAVATDADKLFETEADRYVWSILQANTEHMRSRQDDMPIYLKVSRSHSLAG
ncbi:hypothetical protein GOB57_25025 [Sinorhizobium meliloti]|nr:hypothetical protein [Sinorhizobium meliloti]